MYNLGRPVLVGTTTIEKSELLAALLTELQLPYRLLNARPENIESESEIVSQAGCKNAITIATNMAGRGTDIVLGGNPKSRTLLRFQKFITYSKSLAGKDQVEVPLDEFSTLSKLFKDLQLPDYIYTYDQFLQYLEANPDLPVHLSEELKDNFNQIYESDKNIAISDRSIVQQLGGLHVIGTERHESRRIDNQLRGRSGRQGDPGSSRFFLSLEDKLLRIFGGDKISDLIQNIGLEESVPIQSTFLNQSLESAQKKVESYYFDIRKKLFEYDQALNTQRNGIYIERRRILEINNLRDWIIEYAERSLYDVVFFMSVTQNELIKSNTLQKVQYLLGTPFLFHSKQFGSQEEIRLTSYLQQQFQISYALKDAEMELIEPGLLRELERSFLLQQIDFSWKEHLQKISTLRDAVGWRAYGQKDPLTEYKQEAYNFFVIMLTRIRHRVVYFVLRSRIIINLKP
jgi:preprotein translocase subunit SecA